MSAPFPRPWRPLLEGEAASRARTLGEQLASRLAHAETALDDGSLAEGAAGAALALAYLGSSWPGVVTPALIERAIDRAVELVATRAMAPGLFGGYCGAAWMLAHLGEAHGVDDESFAEIDAALRAHLGRDARQLGHDHDLTDGLCGLAVYARERMPRPEAAALLAMIVDRLAALATPMLGGLAWSTAPDALADGARGEHPRGAVDLGVAHGLPGVIATLAAAISAGVAVAPAGALLHAAWRALDACAFPAELDSSFPAWHSAGAPSRPTRSAWCYGDPGAARAMYVAAQATADAPRARHAWELARRAAQRPRPATLCSDPGLCHGAAGLAHLFNRMWQDTSDDDLRDAARAWLEEVLAMPLPDDSSLLTGTAGIALALAAATSAVEPRWDRFLLLSLAAPNAP